MTMIPIVYCSRFFFNDTATTEIYTLSLHDALPIWAQSASIGRRNFKTRCAGTSSTRKLSRSSWGEREFRRMTARSEEHTSELQSRQYLVCRLLLEKKNNKDPSDGMKHEPTDLL